MSDPATAIPDTSTDLDQLCDRFKSGSEKVQLQLIPELAGAGEAGLKVLMEFLLEHRTSPPNAVLGSGYQALYAARTPEAIAFLQTNFPQGIVPLRSEREIDYSGLQKSLAEGDFLQADRLTIEKLCELAGTEAIQRKWLYFTEVENFPGTDLQTIDALWFVHSEGKFGFGVQRELWLSLGKNWEKLWAKIGWKNANNWTRYPHEFTWDLTAPKGHLPLSNQLRGVRVISSLLSHPTWSGSQS
ncbi:MAG: GUN4 domain-containing protein [Cyanosarcina radialis HA8281-LM2]|jgi:hypothetical protein|nr:GUN4 domain-containing protein [Cyanosarcina radialis HA8281-LM2]